MAKKPTSRPLKKSGHRRAARQHLGYWLVPLQSDGYACFYHGHEDDDDHSLCGPQIFCCQKAATLFTRHYANVFPPGYRLTPMSYPSLLAWLTPSGPQVFYFYFCDPINPQRLYFQGFSDPLLRPVLRFDKALEDLVVGSQVVV